MTDLAIPHRDGARLTAADVRKVLMYDPVTGAFTWHCDIRGGQGSIKVKAGTVAGGFDIHGYRTIRIRRVSYRAARLAWLWMTGKWPALIDHKNGLKGDDRWVNLREANKSINAHNIHRPNRCSTVGFRGVQRSGNQFTARIIIDGRRMHLGSFLTLELAHAAYLEAKHRHRPGALI